VIKFCHLAATSIHETLRRPQQIIPHDYLKILDLERMTWVDEMRKKIGTDYASTCVVCIAAATERCGRGRATRRYGCIRSFHSILYNVVNRGVLQAMWQELAGKVVHRDQLIICYPRLYENSPDKHTPVMHIKFGLNCSQLVETVRFWGLYLRLLFGNFPLYQSVRCFIHGFQRGFPSRLHDRAVHLWMMMMLCW